MISETLTTFAFKAGTFLLKYSTTNCFVTAIHTMFRAITNEFQRQTDTVHITFKLVFGTLRYFVVGNVMITGLLIFIIVIWTIIMPITPGTMWYTRCVVFTKIPIGFRTICNYGQWLDQLLFRQSALPQSILFLIVFIYFMKVHNVQCVAITYHNFPHQNDQHNHTCGHTSAFHRCISYPSDTWSPFHFHNPRIQNRLNKFQSNMPLRQTAY